MHIPISNNMMAQNLACKVYDLNVSKCWFNNFFHWLMSLNEVFTGGSNYTSGGSCSTSGFPFGSFYSKKKKKIEARSTNESIIHILF